MNEARATCICPQVDTAPLVCKHRDSRRVNRRACSSQGQADTGRSCPAFIAMFQSDCRLLIQRICLEQRRLGRTKSNAGWAYLLKQGPSLIGALRLGLGMRGQMRGEKDTQTALRRGRHGHFTKSSVSGHANNQTDIGQSILPQLSKWHWLTTMQTMNKTNALQPNQHDIDITNSNTRQSSVCVR